MSLILMILISTTAYGQRFANLKQAVESHPKQTFKAYQKALKKHPERVNMEEWAVSLKYYQKLDESAKLFENLDISNQLSTNGKIEYLELLATKGDWTKFKELTKKGDVNFSDDDDKFILLLSRMSDKAVSDYAHLKKCYVFDCNPSKNPDIPDMNLFWVIEGIEFNDSKIEYCFDNPGIYEVRLDSRFTDAAVEVPDTTFNVEVPEIPALEYPEQPATGVVGQSISFKGTTVNSEESFTSMWDMGNGTYIIGESFNYSFSMPGNYKVINTMLPADPEMERVETITFIFING